MQTSTLGVVWAVLVGWAIGTAGWYATMAVLVGHNATAEGLAFGKYFTIHGAGMLVGICGILAWECYRTLSSLYRRRR